jgi:hypothetical protein
MKRIALALFAIGAVVAGGYFATSAFFTDTITQNNFTFNTGTASLKFGFCPGTATDCSGVVADRHDYSFSTASTTGPGLSGTSCLVIENTGQYLMHLTSRLDIVSATADGMRDAFQVSAATADSSCNPGSGAVIYPTQSARSAATAGDVGVGDLAAGARMYVLISNSWDSAGNQNALQGQSIVLDTSVTGKTD